MSDPTPQIPLTDADVRAIVEYTAACAEQTLVVFAKAVPDDPRPAAALEAARAFAGGAGNSEGLAEAAAVAMRAADAAPTEAARHAALAAIGAVAAARLQPVADTAQLALILGPAAQAARAAELARGDDPVVAEYVVTAAAKRATPEVLDVLRRYPRAPQGDTRVDALMHRLDALLRDPPPPRRVVDDPGPFFHGTKADLRPGDLLTPGWQSNYGSRRQAKHLYITASSQGAPLAAEMAQGEGPGRVYRVEPLGTIEDDPNVTDKRFPGNPTRSYRTTEPLRVVEEVVGWEPPPADLIATLRAHMGELAELGIEAMDD